METKYCLNKKKKEEEVKNVQGIEKTIRTIFAL